MDDKKLNPIDANNNNLNSHGNNNISKSSIVSINKKHMNQANIATEAQAVSSTSTVSSVSISSINDFKNANIKFQNQQKVTNFNEKENHFISSNQNEMNLAKEKSSDKPVKYGELIVLG